MSKTGGLNGAGGKLGAGTELYCGGGGAELNCCCPSLGGKYLLLRWETSALTAAMMAKQTMKDFCNNRNHN